MEFYRCTQFAGVTFAAGQVLHLTSAQAARRAGRLEDMGKGCYRVTGPVSFKRGETIGLHGEVNKGLLAQVAPVKKTRKKKKSQDPAEMKNSEPAADAVPVCDPPPRLGSQYLPSDLPGPARDDIYLSG